MNPKAKKFRVRPCVVCGYKYSDLHHTYPRYDGGKETVALCPNHHRYANMIQAILHGDPFWGETRARKFAQEHFDSEFNEKMLDNLIGDYFTDSPYDEDGLTAEDYADAMGTPVVASSELATAALGKTILRLEVKHGSNHKQKQLHLR